MAKIPINPRDFTVAWPDGPVNRHCQLVVFVDTETGALTGEPALDVARHEALGPRGDLPVEQLVGAGTASSAELDALREEVKQLRAERDQRETSGGVS